MKIMGLEIPKVIMKLCKPAQFYLALSLISAIIYLISMLRMNDVVIESEPEGGHVHHYTFGGFVIKVLFTILWVYLLNYICQFKYGKKISWFIVLLPFFFMGIMLLGMIIATSYLALQNKKKQELHRELSIHKKKVIEKENELKKSQQPRVNQPSKEPLIEGFQISGYKNGDLAGANLDDSVSRGQILS